MTYAALQSLIPDDASCDIDWKGFIALLPSLATLASTPQDPKHHAEGDVWTHTKMVCEAMVSSSNYSDALTPEHRFVLFMACLLHDIAKPATTEHQPDGHITARGHSSRGAVDARIALWRAGTPFDLREQICRIIQVHQVPFWAMEDEGHRSPEFIAHRLSVNLNLADLIAVAKADMRGRICDDQKQVLDNIELFETLADIEGCLESPKTFPDRHTRISYFRREGAIPADFPFFQEAGSKVTVLCGLPASGKDTWCVNYGAGRAVISFDDAIYELGLKHGGNVGAAIHMAQDRAKELLRNKEPFIWNATHLSADMRKKTLDLLYKYNAEVELVYLEAPEAIIKSRNTKRDSTLPNATIDRMLHRWEVPLMSEAHQVRYQVLEPEAKRRPRI